MAANDARFDELQNSDFQKPQCSIHMKPQVPLANRNTVGVTAFAVAAVLTLPFLAAATVITLALSSAGEQLGKCYAANLIRSDQKPLSGARESDTRSRWGNFVSGLVITLSNPKVIIFYCGFLPTFLDLSILTLLDLVTVVAIISTVLVGVLGTYAYLASRARKMFTQRRSVRRLNRAAGSVMVAAGVVIAVRS